MSGGRPDWRGAPLVRDLKRSGPEAQTRTLAAAGMPGDEAEFTCPIPGRGWVADLGQAVDDRVIVAMTVLADPAATLNTLWFVELDLVPRPPNVAPARQRIEPRTPADRGGLATIPMPPMASLVVTVANAGEAEVDVTVVMGAYVLTRSVLPHVAVQEQYPVASGFDAVEASPGMGPPPLAVVLDTAPEDAAGVRAELDELDADEATLAFPALEALVAGLDEAGGEAS